MTHGMNIDQYLDMFSVNARKRNVIRSARLLFGDVLWSDLSQAEITLVQFGNIKKLIHK